MDFDYDDLVGIGSSTLTGVNHSAVGVTRVGMLSGCGGLEV